jgi:hypothetical protein
MDILDGKGHLGLALEFLFLFFLAAALVHVSNPVPTTGS